MEEQIQIEEILTESNSVFQRDRVERYAKALMGSVKGMTELSAYQLAYWMIITVEQ